MTCECFSIKSINWDKNDKRERVLWLHDVYHHPIYNADEGKNVYQNRIGWSILSYFSLNLAYFFSVHGSVFFLNKFRQKN
jgi:hypothetical protein